MACGSLCTNIHHVGDGLVVIRSSCQIRSHSLGDLCLGWIASQRIDWVIELSDLIHTSTRHMECVKIYPRHVVPGNNAHHHDDVMMVLHILPNLVPQFGYSVAWMDSIQGYSLYSSVAIHYLCTHKTCGMGDNTSMTTCTLYQIQHLPGDGLVVCRSYKLLAHSFGGMWPGLRASTCMGYILDL